MRASGKSILSLLNEMLYFPMWINIRSIKWWLLAWPAWHGRTHGTCRKTYFGGESYEWTKTHRHTLYRWFIDVHRYTSEGHRDFSAANQSGWYKQRWGKKTPPPQPHAHTHSLMTEGGTDWGCSYLVCTDSDNSWYRPKNTHTWYQWRDTDGEPCAITALCDDTEVIFAS